MAKEITYRKLGDSFLKTGDRLLGEFANHSTCSLDKLN